VRGPDATDRNPPGYVPPPYPQDRLAELRRIAVAYGGDEGGMVDCSVGSPVDPMPEVAVRALQEATASATGYPASIGSTALREAAAGWIDRRFGIAVAPETVIACVGTKELVAGLPRLLSMRDPSRDTLLYPAVSYPTYLMGADLAGLRAVPVPVDTNWQLDLGAIDPDDAARALLLWLNDPSNPTGATASPERMHATVEWARARGIIVASDECYAEFTYDATGAAAAPVTALQSGAPGVLVVHSLSKRSNMAGLRAGFVAGDPGLIDYLGEMRKHAGLMIPSPIQTAAAAALGDDVHVEDQRGRYARRRAQLLPALEAFGLVHDGGPSTFYLWLRAVAEPEDAQAEDGWSIADRLARVGIVPAPGDLYGAAGHRHVRLALTVTDDRVALMAQRLSST
jgi:succinyldiaminopimelate transaminase